MNEPAQKISLRIVAADHADLSGRAAPTDRGDVPGWVLITLMTAGLVVVIWGLAGPALSGVFEQAIERVSSF
ncbi:hypothetical protein B0I08_102172 [Glaciihabitans tibetensis]|uniref:Flagellin-like protein n=1 Tax=Glaciihabitans tibetensis TaxID=1266600 RepID=A0A2T0VH02_9MICO|nr:hypothetical protein [Glaciihabitans tibetensis]PRY69497.1 hypothetical protein B0I08_102172 [Glaciihabitans tibetensis]